MCEITWLAHLQQDSQFWALAGHFSYVISFWKAPFFLHASSYSQIIIKDKGTYWQIMNFCGIPRAERVYYRGSSSPGPLEILESQWLPLIQVSLEGQGGQEAQGAHLSLAVLCAIQVLHLFRDLLFPLASLGFLYHLLRSEVLQIPWLKS